ncbi:hypothetical protein B0J11DRAFT_596808 [Dendryphion nanum]|uniref:Uncharacterized protein n=1 Tax=Dendryphion nanum TaxID=256645 RepID=A0A9P9IZ09_9PLEO|nr:hypothetical protein B0J11DRAFT_596808 [Dendryphion nanum]
MSKTFLTLFALATVCLSATTWSENLVLADCGIGLGPNGGSTSREMMYYSNAAWGAPTYMKNVPWDGSYPWRTSGVSQTLPNGDKWSVVINNTVGDPKLAGFAWHTYDPVALACWSRHLDGLFTLADGKKCSMAYICNHTPPPAPVPAPVVPPTKFTFNVREETVALVGHHTPSSILNLVEWSGTEGRYCADKRITIPNSAKFNKPTLPDCSIKFSCGPNRAKMMNSAAIQIAEKTNGLWKYETQDLPNCKKTVTCMTPQSCVTVCHQNAECTCGGQPDRREVTNVPGRVVLDIEGDAQSRFEYEIVCPKEQREKDCGICNAAKLGALALDLVSFGLASALVGGACSMDGC